MPCEGGAAAILVLDERGVGAEWERSGSGVGAAAEKCDSCERGAQAELVLRVGEGMLFENSPIS